MTEPLSPPAEAQFPLFEGGPFYPLQTSLRLTGTEQRHIRRRITTAVLLTWVPLVLLAAVQGRAIGPNWRQSMLLDPAMYARYLVAMPLLILATPKVRRKLKTIVYHFQAAGLVKEQDRELFFTNISSVLRQRDSLVAAVVIVALAIAKTVATGVFSVAEMHESWRVLGTAGHWSLSLAGWWQFAVCDTLYGIIVLLLLYRMALLWRFFWKTSRLDLRLNAAHPDGAGGLAFLGIMLPAFRLPLFAIAASSAGALANLMLHMGAPFADFRYAVAAFAAGLVAIVAGPFLLFNGQLRKAKEQAALACGALAGRQLNAFEKKWLGQSSSDAQEMLQTQDFSAVADLNVTVAAMRKMNKLPFWPKQLVPLVIAVLLPFVPVAAIEIPLKEILLQVVKLVR
jgi:hypothetical protein